jgi:hypothetical protein
MAAATKKKKRKEEAYPWKAGASSWHITTLKKSILQTLDIYGATYIQGDQKNEKNNLPTFSKSSQNSCQTQ